MERGDCSQSLLIKEIVVDNWNFFLALKQQIENVLHLTIARIYFGGLVKCFYLYVCIEISDFWDVTLARGVHHLVCCAYVL